MRQQDANRTREWLEKTAGQTYVTQATSYHGGGIGQYREAQNAELRQVSRVDWADLQRLIEGEAIVLFGGRRIYAKLFHAKVDTSGPIRLNRPLMLAAPRLEEIQAGSDMTARIVDNLLTGRVALGAEEPETPTLSALLQAFRDGADQGRPMAACARAAIDAAGQDQRQQIKAGALNQHDSSDAEPPVTDLLPMLEAASLRRVSQSNNIDTSPVTPVNADLMRTLMAIEMHANSTPHAARRNCLAAIADRDAALPDQKIARPAPLQRETFIAMIEHFISNIEH
jgi:intracellular multiplication protein IcmO